MPRFEERLAKALCDCGISHYALCKAADVEPFRDERHPLPFATKSVLFVALPYGGTAGKVARYARGEDYHRRLPALLERAFADLADTGVRHASFADISPYFEVPAAERAGLGTRLANRLLSVSGCGTACLIGETVLDVACTAFGSGEPPENRCVACGRCLKSCPTGALCSGDFSHCLSEITQTRRELSEKEEQFIRGAGTIWGCDRCTECCPQTLFCAGEPSPDLSETLTLTDGAFRKKYADRAFSYRGIKPLRRNLLLLKGSGNQNVK